MQKEQIRSYKLYSNRLLFLFLLLVGLGIFFRFVNVGQKVYWGDETVTSLRISGFTLKELKKQAFQGDSISVRDLQKYQYPNPEKSAIDTFKGLAAEEPQHPPLYFVMVRLWVQLFGNSVAVTRSFSVLISLLAFPSIYWLCQELFNSPITGWVAIVLIAISPFHVLYAQEARSYSLWTVTILLSSATLLRAIRLGTKFSWGLYTVTLALSLYTILLSGLVAIGHGIYVVVKERFRLSRTVKAYLLACLGGLLLFLPWIFAIIANSSETDETTSWTKNNVPLKSLIKTWFLNLSRVFFDLNYNLSYRNLFMYLVILITFILVVYSIYFLCYKSPREVWLFILTLIGVTAIALVLPDLVLGGRRSSVPRYLIPSYLGIHIAIAYLLSTQISSISVNLWRQKLWQLVTIVIISGGVLSCVVSSQAEYWWNKYNAFHLTKMAHIVNQAEQPLFITSWLGFMPLSHVLSSKVQLQTLEPQYVNLTSRERHNELVRNYVDNSFHNVFTDSEKALQTLLEKDNKYQVENIYSWKQQIEPVYKTEATLWKLAKSEE